VNSRDRRPECWSAQAGERDVARLDIPPDAARERQFEVFVQLVVRQRRGGATALGRHGLRVLANGAVEWQREVATHGDGEDTLDLRLRRRVPPGEALRLTALCELKGPVARQSLTITAEED
jgi:hypothetical protein